MNLGQIAARARRLKGSPTTTRWSASDLAAFANDAQIATALKVDILSATLLIPTLTQPAVPVLTVEGTPGSTTINYALVIIATTGAGDSIPSTTAQVQNAPAVLSNANYVQLALATIPGRVYRVLRQIVGTDFFPQLLTQFVAAGTTTTFNDQGQFTPIPYKISRGNEYGLPDLVKVKRVYMLDVAGDQQELYPTEIAWLGGDTNETFDHSSGTVQGLPQFTPQWIAQGPVPYPVQVAGNGRVPVTTPWRNVPLMGNNQGPAYYLNYGMLGVLPPTIAGAGNQIQVDLIPKPPIMQQFTDLSAFPDGFCDCLAWKMLSYMEIGDDTTRDVDFEARWERACAELRIEYVDNIQGNKPHGLIPMPLRAQMREWTC
jgi:hypothetical protein